MLSTILVRLFFSYLTPRQLPRSHRAEWFSQRDSVRRRLEARSGRLSCRSRPHLRGPQHRPGTFPRFPGMQAHVCHPFFTQRHPNLRFKVGSLQEFVQDADLVSDWSPSKFSAFEVQKIAFLDMYLMNTDRNDANIMVCKKRQITADDAFLLIPIDHGYTMPDLYELNEWSWCWLDWKQMKRPWDDRIVEYFWNSRNQG